MVIGHLEVSTWQGISVGAVHWYCTVHVEDNDKELESIDLQRPISSKEALVMNKEQQVSGLLYCRNKSGDMTEGFNTEQEAIDAGIDYFKSKYNGVLFDSGHACYSAWKKIILNPKQFDSLVKEMNALADKFQSLNGYEGKEKILAEKLDDSWGKLYSKLLKLCKSS